MGYETNQNIADEEKLVRLFAEDMGTGQPIQTPQYWPFDYLVPVGSKLSACECRQRHNTHDHYATLHYSSRKWQSLLFAKRIVSGVFLVVGWTDKWGYLRVGESGYRVSFGGRAEVRAGSSSDREWMIEIPISDFTMKDYPWVMSQPAGKGRRVAAGDTAEVTLE